MAPLSPSTSRRLRLPSQSPRPRLAPLLARRPLLTRPLSRLELSRSPSPSSRPAFVRTTSFCRATRTSFARASTSASQTEPSAVAPNAAGESLASSSSNRLALAFPPCYALCCSRPSDPAYALASPPAAATTTSSGPGPAGSARGTTTATNSTGAARQPRCRPADHSKCPRSSRPSSAFPPGHPRPPPPPRRGHRRWTEGALPPRSQRLRAPREPGRAFFRLASSTLLTAMQGQSRAAGPRPHQPIAAPLRFPGPELARHLVSHVRPSGSRRAPVRVGS